jgi:hypothetical protein
MTGRGRDPFVAAVVELDHARCLVRRAQLGKSRELWAACDAACAAIEQAVESVRAAEVTRARWQGLAEERGEALMSMASKMAGMDDFTERARPGEPVATLWAWVCEGCSAIRWQD